ncbi:hypothetical protein NBH00_24420 [Paraconexibacter antarcticus]|uniref:MucBP domain-containing protein n=1 Tax=Paraconexibacter antarcticus TaxID=2949664 RepID=A0ABY5DUY7_9ACTN|nr:hypothetical protein [Paraconexibacter antarcticus]UTI64470.1 hypothetical protein NBH00_24420 [Paraconexibacter antarcticus]
MATHELTDVARRIYGQSVHGRGVATAVKRLHRITALATALETGDRAAVKAVFLPIRHQIVRVELFHARRLVYSYGHAPTFAPIRGTLTDASGKVAGRYVLAVTDQKAYAGLLQRLTGATVVFRHGAGRANHPRAGTRIVTIPSHAYPTGAPLSLDVAIPQPSPSLCGATPADTRLNTIGYVGRRLLTAESTSRAVMQTLRHVAMDPAFRAATAAGDPVAIRHAIIFDFFRDHSIHVVRVRVTRGTKLVYDLGGPFALQPASSRVMSPDGRTSATFSLAVQDDTGYIKLMHRFTGAAVQLVSPLGKVPGSTLEPGPDVIPDHGPVTYRGKRYLADSFDGTAFPKGTLRVSLLVPA